ncbi:nicotinate-nucleotide adenylyltransferase [Colwellia asteriadis]|uniref:Probable nicotinate-nucleotide adenylyltransferase n=1 Tax=Colwellia asteriadis TaxID=517723 RepID=A0ABP3WQ78_9GAMM
MKTPLEKNGIGIFGGTFDPIHNGHIQSAKMVSDWLGLANVLFIPAHIPPHKTQAHTIPHASATQRATMVSLACQPFPQFICDKRELTRSGHSYSVDTLKALKAEYPEQTLYFIIGMDSLLTFTQWHQYQDILTLCHLVVNTRPNYDISQVNQATKTLLENHQVDSVTILKQQKNGAIIFAPPVHFDISSTQIRANLCQQQCCKSSLSPLILDFINKNQLYR